MKVFGHGHYADREPALRFSLGLPGVALVILGLDDEAQIAAAVDLAAAYRPLDPGEQAELIAAVRPLVEQDARDSKKGESALFWLHETTVMGWQQQDEPVLVAY